MDNSNSDSDSLIHEQYQRIVELMHSIGHPEFDEYELIQRVAYRMKIYDEDEQDALDGIEKYYLETKEVKIAQENSKQPY